MNAWFTNEPLMGEEQRNDITHILRILLLEVMSLTNGSTDKIH